MRGRDGPMRDIGCAAVGSGYVCSTALLHRMVACLVAAALVVSAGGCTATLNSVWPSQPVSDEVVVAQSITIHSAPEGAEVSTDDGRVLGQTPLRYELPYTAKRRWKRRSKTPIVLGVALFAIARPIEGTFDEAVIHRALPECRRRARRQARAGAQPRRDAEEGRRTVRADRVAEDR